jgi:hypothetical protein
MKMAAAKAVGNRRERAGKRRAVSVMKDFQNILGSLDDRRLHFVNAVGASLQSGTPSLLGTSGIDTEALSEGAHQSKKLGKD